MDIEKIREVIGNVEGFFYENEAILLANWAQHVPDVIVELGTYRGRSAIILALASPATTRIYCVDAHIKTDGDPYPFGDEDRAAFLKNLVNFGVAGKVHPIDLNSHDAWKAWTEPITMLWIDAGHSCADVKEDIEGWLPFVRADGLVAFHDVSAPQIMQAINEYPELEFLDAADHTRIYARRVSKTLPLPEIEALPVPEKPKTKTKAKK